MKIKWLPPLVLILLLSFVLLLGCTDSGIPAVPFTVSQFVNKTTDLNYALFAQGYYDGNCLYLDGNKLSVTDCNIGGAGSGSWNDLTDFPTGCGANQAVQIIGATLTCIDINVGSGSNYFDTNTLNVINGLDLNNSLSYSKIDTNFQTAGLSVADINNLWRVNGNNIFNLNSGNVGIGTTNPQAAFDINARGHGYAYGLRLSDPDGTHYTSYLNDYGISWINTNNQTLNIVTGTGSLALGKQYDNPYVMINPSGNVGVNLASPSYKLDVNGGSTAWPLRATSTGGGILRLDYNSQQYASFNVTSAGALQIQPTNGWTYHNTSGVANYIFTYNNATGNYSAISGDAITLSGNILNLSRTGGYYTGGNLGIGTTNPQNKLNVIGDINATGNIYMNGTLITQGNGTDTNWQTSWSTFDTNTKNQYRLYTVDLNTSGNVNASGAGNNSFTGNVGIGTTTPATQLQIDSVNGGVIRLSRNDNVFSGTDVLGDIQFYTNDASDSGGVPGTGIAGSIKFLGGTNWNSSGLYGRLGFFTTQLWPATANNIIERMSIDTAGNVGIGTTSPSYKLDVNSGSTATPLHVASTGGNQLRLDYNSQQYAVFNVTSGGALQIQPTSGWTYWNTSGKDNYFFVYNNLTGKYSMQSGDFFALSGYAAQISRTGASWFNGGNVGIGTTNPSYLLDVNKGSSGIAIRTDANISAGGYITSTESFDKSKGKALSFIKDADEYKTNGKIDDNKFMYSKVKYIETVIDKPATYEDKNFKISDAWIETIILKEAEYDENDKIINPKKTQTINHPAVYETRRIEKTPATYKDVERIGVSIDAEIALLKQAIFEIKTCIINENDLQKIKNCVNK